jgi:hypothetical protein
MWKINTAAWPRFMRDAIVEASVVTAIVAVCAYLIALYVPKLLVWVSIILVALYLTAPFCWLMPLTLRRGHLTLLLALVLAKWTEGLFTLWGDGLILDAPVTIAGKIFQTVLDVLFLLNGISAVRARSTEWQLIGPHTLSIIAAPTVGTTIALLLWSAQISHEITDQVQSLTHSAPYCLAVNGRVIKSLADASGLQLVRNKNFIGPGAGFSFPMMFQHYAVLAVQDDKTVRYWNWSFLGRRFMPLRSPMQGLGSYACNPLTKEAIVDEDRERTVAPARNGVGRSSCAAAISHGRMGHGQTASMSAATAAIAGSGHGQQVAQVDPVRRQAGDFPFYRFHLAPLGTA